MRGNTLGRFLTITTFGESHGPALGTVIDGCPAGIELFKEDFQKVLNRRKPGQNKISTDRAESDEPEILSGVFENKTLGTPIAVMVRNNQHSPSDYDPHFMRPGHADEVWQKKYGYRDWRGGGRSSGRETLSRVMGGVVAQKIMPSQIQVCGFTKAIGSHVANNIPSVLNAELVDQFFTRCPDPEISKKMEETLMDCKTNGNSLGGIAEVRIDNIPMGWGEPVFRKLKSELSSGMMSIGGAIGFELGTGFDGASMFGSEYHSHEHHAGGIQGGISNGNQIVFRVAFKPISTLGEKSLKGRHDPCILPRVIPVLEAMCFLVLADAYLEARLNQ